MRQPVERAQRGQCAEEQSHGDAPPPGHAQKVQGGKGNEEPSFVSRQRPGAGGDARAGHRPPPLGLAEPHAEIRERHQRREEDRFGHGRRLQVKKVGIQREKRGGGYGGGRGCERPPHGRKQERACRHKTRRRGDGAGNAASPPLVGTDEGQHQQVRKRQPRGADLVVSRSLRIENAARDVEVRFGVAVVEQPAAAIEEPDRRGAPGGQSEDHPNHRPCSLFLHLLSATQERSASWERLGKLTSMPGTKVGRRFRLSTRGFTILRQTSTYQNAVQFLNSR